MLALLHLISRLLSLIDEPLRLQSQPSAEIDVPRPIWHHSGSVNSRIFPRDFSNNTVFQPTNNGNVAPTNGVSQPPPAESSPPPAQLRLANVHVDDEAKTVSQPPPTESSPSPAEIRLANIQVDTPASSNAALASTSSSAQASPSASAQAIQSTGPERDVYAITDVWLQDKMVSPVDGVDLFTSHSSLQMAGTDVDGPLLVEFGDGSHELDSSSLHLRVLESPITTSNNISTNSAGRFLFHAGTTTLRNKDFLDPASGAGLVADAWATDAVYRTGVPDVNEAVQLIGKLLQAMNLTIPSDATANFHLSNRWHAEIAHTVNTDLVDLYHDYADSENNGTAIRAKFTVNETIVRPIRTPFSGPEFPPELSESPSINFAKLPPIPQGFYLSLPEYDLESAILQAAAVKAAKLPTNANPGSSPNAPTMEQGSSPKAPTTDLQVGRAATLSRIAGTATAINVIAKSTVAATGLAGVALGASIIILDFIHGKWVGGSFGLLGLGVGLAIGLLDAGPIGWIVGGIVAAFFAILPGLFAKKYDPGQIDQPEKIIQWTMFGDRDHTGNEACRANNATYHGNPNCTAVYGPGTISAALGLNNFDAIAFLLHFNEGYPMSIPDMAKAFQVINPNQIVDDGKDAPATIDCRNKQPRYLPGGDNGFTGDDPDLCNHPLYAIKRELINIPVINQTAAQVYDRIIPAPGGDCKLLTFPGSQSFPQYNLTVDGLPSVIACNLSASLNVSGTAQPIAGAASLPPPPPNPNPNAPDSPSSSSSASSSSSSSAPQNSQTPSLISPGTASTDGQSGHQLAAPPPTPFLTLNITNAICLSGPQGSVKHPPPKKNPATASLCLPPGTYDGQTGSLGFQSGYADTLTFPPGPTAGNSVNVNFKTPQYSHQQSKTFNRAFTTPLSGSLDLSAVLFHLTETPEDTEKSLVLATPVDAPVVCLFTGVSFHGDVACFGVGGGDLPANIKGRAMSVSCHGGVSVWLYVESYGDAGGVEVRGDVDDLGKEDYGVDGHLGNRVVSMWVRGGASG